MKLVYKKFLYESINIKDLEKSLSEKYNVELTLYLNNNSIMLDRIVVPKSNRSNGVGGSVMTELINYADDNNLIIYLNLAGKNDGYGTTSRNRLINFYKQFGFVLNKGKNVDYTISYSMYRKPKSTTLESQESDYYDIPSVLYHATYGHLLPNIKEKGLGNTTNTNWTDSKPGVVYLADKPSIAESYAETAEDVPEKYLDNIVVLYVFKDDLKKELLYLDSNVIDGKHTYEYHGIIPWDLLYLEKDNDEDDESSNSDEDDEEETDNYASDGYDIDRLKRDSDHKYVSLQGVNYRLGYHSKDEIVAVNQIENTPENTFYPTQIKKYVDYIKNGGIIDSFPVSVSSLANKLSDMLDFLDNNQFDERWEEDIDDDVKVFPFWNNVDMFMDIYFEIGEDEKYPMYNRINKHARNINEVFPLDNRTPEELELIKHLEVIFDFFNDHKEYTLINMNHRFEAIKELGVTAVWVDIV